MSGNKAYLEWDCLKHLRDAFNFLGTSDSAVNTSLLLTAGNTRNCHTASRTEAALFQTFTRGPLLRTEPSFSKHPTNAWETASGPAPSLQGRGLVWDSHLQWSFWSSARPVWRTLCGRYFSSPRQCLKKKREGRKVLITSVWWLRTDTWAAEGLRAHRPSSTWHAGPAQPGGGGSAPIAPPAAGHWRSPKDAGRCRFEWERLELGAGAGRGRGSGRAALRDPCGGRRRGRWGGIGTSGPRDLGAGGARRPPAVPRGDLPWERPLPPPVARAAAAAASPSPPRSLHSPAPGGEDGRAFVRRQTEVTGSGACEWVGGGLCVHGQGGDLLCSRQEGGWSGRGDASREIRNSGWR